MEMSSSSQNSCRCSVVAFERSEEVGVPGSGARGAGTGREGPLRSRRRKVPSERWALQQVLTASEAAQASRRGPEGSVREGDLRKGHWIGVSRVVPEIGDNSKYFLN